MNSEKIINDLVKSIKAVKIQGAERISVESVKTLKKVIEYSDANTPKKIFLEIVNFARKVEKARPTEPCLKNSMSFIIRKSKKYLNADPLMFIKQTVTSCDEVINHFEKSKEKINELVYRKIPNNSVVFTHCHSSTVVDALIYARKKGKKFEVHNTETRPLYQGRITAKELSSAGIKVTHYVDSAARLALKKADIMLIGSDSITSEGKVINKIGSELFSEIAHNYDVPAYSCTDSWKFDVNSVFAFESQIEKRFEKEVWPKKPRGVTISNFAFEKVNPENLTGIISELGIFRPTIFMEEFKRAYSILMPNNKTFFK